MITSAPRAPRLSRFLRPLCAALLGAASGAAAFGASETLPHDGEVARGLRIGGVEVARGQAPSAAVEAAARRVLDRRVALAGGDETLIEASNEDLGGRVDTAFLADRAAAVGREGGILARLDAALEARAGHVDLPVRVDLPVEPLAARLARLKEERDSAPRAAKLDLAHHTATDHAPGRYLDVYAAASAVVDALAARR